MGSGGAGGVRRLDALGGRAGVEGPDQPVERRVVDQVVHDSVQGLPHLGQVDPAGAQHAVGQLAQPIGRVEAGVHVRGGAAEGQRLLLYVVGEPLQAGDQDQTGGLELLGQGTGQGQGPRLDHLSGQCFCEDRGLT